MPDALQVAEPRSADEVMVGVRADIGVQVSVDGRLSTTWVRACALVTPIIGKDRAYRIAVKGAHRLLRVRFDDGRWHFLRRDEQ